MAENVVPLFGPERIPLPPGLVASDGGGPHDPRMESRVSTLEAEMKAVKSDISDIKTDLRGMRQDLNAFGREVSAEFRAIRTELAGYRVEAKSDLWKMIGTMIAGFSGLLGVMAKGFGWL